MATECIEISVNTPFILFLSFQKMQIVTEFADNVFVFGGVDGGRTVESAVHNDISFDFEFVGFLVITFLAKFKQKLF